MNIYYELVGIAASVFLIAAISFKSTSTKFNVLMRVFNGIGNLLFIIYGLLINSLSTSICNGIILVLNIINIITLCKKEMSDE